MNDASSTPSPPRISLVVGLSLIFVFVIVVYFPVLRGGFVWDDLLLVKKNPLVTGELTLRTLWFQADFPLTTVALWLQWLCWGSAAPGYHLVNILLHALNAVFLWRVLTQLNIGGSFLAAILFAVHPVCVASAAWISEQKSTLSLAFCLTSMLWFLQFDQKSVLPDDDRRVRRWYWLSLIAFLLSLLSKTSTVMLPVLLLGCLWWKRGAVTRRDWLRVTPFFALSLGFGLMTIWFQTHQVIREDQVQAENFLGRIALAGMALWFYVEKALLPLNLCMIYPRWSVDSASVIAYMPALLWIGLLGVCWWLQKHCGRGFFLAMAGFTVLLFPVLGFIDMYFFSFARVSDHLQYFPLICLLALLAACLDRFASGKIWWGVSIVSVIALSALAFQRARVFSTDENLWLDTVTKNPVAWNAYNNLGCIRAEQNRMDEAKKHFESSLQFNPRNVKALVNLGRLAALNHKLTEAESHFQAALKLKPDDADARAFYARTLTEQGRAGEAIPQFQESLRVRADTDVRFELANLLRMTGQIRDSMDCLREILRVQPDFVDALNNLAWMLATSSDSQLRNGKEAVQLAERACRLTDYKQARPIGTLAAAYAEAGRFGEAVTMAQKAVATAQAAGNLSFASANHQLLGLYLNGRSYHEPDPSK